MQSIEKKRCLDAVIYVCFFCFFRSLLKFDWLIVTNRLEMSAEQSVYLDNLFDWLGCHREYVIYHWLVICSSQTGDSEIDRRRTTWQPIRLGQPFTGCQYLEAGKERQSQLWRSALQSQWKISIGGQSVSIFLTLWFLPCLCGGCFLNLSSRLCTLAE